MDQQPHVTSDPPADEDESLARNAARLWPPSEHIGPPATNIRIGRYQTKRWIGEGGMGVVYEAIHDELHHSVALKLMKYRAASSEALERFVREARVLANCRHAAIAQVHDAGVHRQGDLEIPYYVMEYVRGGLPITKYASAKGLSVDERLELFAKVCDAIHSVHERGVIHRDIKPENVLVDSSGQPKVIDFGVARVANYDLVVAAHRTLDSSIVGTLPYMSPEQAGGMDAGDIDRRTDVYSLGVVLYELLCGQLPYAVGRKTFNEAIRTIRETPPTPPRSLNKALDADTDTILLKALHKDRDRRYESAAALAKSIRHRLKDEPIPDTPERATGAASRLVRRLTRKHPLASLALMVLCVIGVARVARHAFAAWPFLDELYGRWCGLRLARAWDQPLQHVKLITLLDNTDVEGLAREAGVEGVSASDARSLRRLHGALMRRIAEAGARVVVWDIGFRQPSPYDAAFLDGIGALEKADCAVVVAGGAWRSGDDGLPAVSPALLPHVTWGCTTIETTPPGLWIVHLALQRGHSAPASSLALAAIAAHWHSGKSTNVLMDTHAKGIVLDGVNPISRPTQPQALMPSSKSSVVWLSEVREVDSADVGNGLEAGDHLGSVRVVIPSDAALEASSVSYSEIFRATPAQLFRWFNNKVIVVGDKRAGQDQWRRHPDGRILPTYLAHALAIEHVLDGRIIRRSPMVSLGGINVEGDYVLDAAVGVAGAAVGFTCGARVRRRGALLGVMGLVLAVGLILAFHSRYVLLSPFVPLIVLFLAGELTALVRRAGNQ